MIFNAVQFCAYGVAKDVVQRFSGGQSPRGADSVPAAEAKLGVPQMVAAAAITGFTIAFVEGPIDLFKTQLQTQVFKAQPLYSTFGGCVSYIMKNYGIRGAFQGITPTIARNVPAVSSYFGGYELARESFARQQGVKVDQLPASSVLLAGGLGGFSYWIATYPMDVIKSSMQSDSPDRAQRKFTSIAGTAKILYGEGGVKRFFVGITPCLMRAFPANAVCFLFYEYTVAKLNAAFTK
jgi:solute carrier family 25 carnitine/acylcarnitine transporter 20/29